MKRSSRPVTRNPETHADGSGAGPRCRGDAAQDRGQPPAHARAPVALAAALAVLAGLPSPARAGGGGHCGSVPAQLPFDRAAPARRVGLRYRPGDRRVQAVVGRPAVASLH